MAANKFATMLHKNTNNLTVILIYTVLEWILIILLLLNSIFSYIIIKFADYFGLKTPCLWCSRVDHFFDSRKDKNSYGDLLCESHAKEISRLGYCSNHQNLAQSKDMCEYCSSSQPNYQGMSKNIALFPRVKQFLIIESEEAEFVLRCSCCSVRLDREFLSSRVVIKPSFNDLKYTQNGNLITEPGDDDCVAEGNDSDQSRSDSVVDGEHDAVVDRSVSVPNSGLREIEARNGEFFVMDQYQDDAGTKEKGDNHIVYEKNEEFSSRKDMVEVYCSLSLAEHESGKEDNSYSMKDSFSGDKLVQFCAEQDSLIQIPHQHLEFFVGQGGYQLIRVQSTDSEIEEDQRKTSAEEAKLAVVESMEMEEDENCFVFHPREFDLGRQVYENIEPQTSNIYVYDSDVPEVYAAKEESFEMPINETEADVSIGTEIPDIEQADEIQDHEILSQYTSMNEDPSTSFDAKQVEEELVDVKIMSVDLKGIVMNNEASLSSELNEIEEERVPDTPTSIENLQHLHKKLLLIEKRESGTEESLDGSVISEFEGGEGVNAIEHLKSALKAERKALHGLYAELEEERNASAVAASQTMAMINRLQEEKAAMQMEALQYQRMMEEQSEYDQEALQLLNELIVKREKEKGEVERELEVYRKRVLEYESKQKMRVLRRRKDGCSSCNRSESSFACSSNAGDSDGLSIDFNQEEKEEDGFDHENGNHNTPVDAVLNLEESLANFEEERLSILEHLKVLEAKLFTCDDEDEEEEEEEEEEHFENIKPIEEVYKENGKQDSTGEEINEFGNGFHKEMNGKHHQEGIRLSGGKEKRLLTLFNGISAECEATKENRHVNSGNTDLFHTSAVEKIELENESLGIEEEVDHLYERLQALEADREFLKHCISSMKKGEKGMDLLQEILQHLRDLRNVEHRVRNLSDSTAQV